MHSWSLLFLLMRNKIWLCWRGLTARGHNGKSMETVLHFVELLRERSGLFWSIYSGTLNNWWAREMLLMLAAFVSIKRTRCRMVNMGNVSKLLSVCKCLKWFSVFLLTIMQMFAPTSLNIRNSEIAKKRCYSNGSTSRTALVASNAMQGLIKALAVC